MKRPFVEFAFNTLLLLIIACPCFGQDKKSEPAQPQAPNQQKKETPEKKAPEKKTPEKAASEKKPKANQQLAPDVVLEFVKKHHPEIEDLLNKLKSVKPESYRAALKTLSRSVKRVKSLENSGNKRKYEDALRQWKARSRINLKAVQLGLENNNPQRKQELVELINQDFEARRRQMEGETEWLKKRMATLEKQMSGLSAAREQELKRQLKVANDLSKRIQADKKQAAKKKPAGKGKQKDAGN